MSTLLDRGRAVLTIYPYVTVTDSRGTKKKIPGDKSVQIRATISGDKGIILDVPGQMDVHTLSGSARTFPPGDDGQVGPWHRIVYQGLEYELSEPPRFIKGPSKASDHWRFIMRSRPLR